MYYVVSDYTFRPVKGHPQTTGTHKSKITVARVFGSFHRPFCLAAGGATVAALPLRRESGSTRFISVYFS